MWISNWRRFREMPEEQPWSFAGLCPYGAFDKYPSHESHNFWDNQREKKEKKQLNYEL